MLSRHQHRRGQLIFALQGVMGIETRDSCWTIPPQRALWVPPAQDHEIQVLSDLEMRTIYFEPGFIAQCTEFSRQAEVHAVVASGLLKELVLGLFNPDCVGEMQVLMAQLLLHTLHRTSCLPTHLPMPKDEGLRRVLGHLMANHLWHWPIARLAAEAAMSERSFTRKFSAETGINYRSWRQLARIVTSLNLLIEQRSIKSIAHKLQFASSTAYIAAFRDLLGSTPQHFRQLHRLD